MIIGKQLRAALMAGAAISFLSTVASAAEWRLVEITGPVRITIPGSAPSAGRQNQTLPVGTNVTTAGGGRATLDNGEQRIVVAPNSRLTVQPEAGGFTRIAQDLGAAMFKVDKKAAPHFRVDTPLLAAIVKGTTFTVMVQGTSDAVSVAEGLVEVRSNLNAAIGSDIAAGATGTVMRDSPSAVQVVTPASAPAGPAPAPINIAPIDYKAASDGLIDIAPPVAQAGQDAAVIRAVAAEPSNNAVGASVQDSPAVATGGSIGAAVSQIASVESGQRETATQIATLTTAINGNGNNGLALGVSSNGNGNGNNGNGNGNGGSDAGAATNPAAGGNGNSGNGNTNGASANNGSSGNANGNPGNGNSGNGNNGNGNGNGGSTAVADAASGSSGNGNANGNANGNSGNGNANGNGNSGNGNSGNGNAGNSGGLIGAVVVPVVNTVTDIAGGLTSNGNSENGNSGNGNANGNNGNNGNAIANGNSGNGNGNGNNGNGNGNGGANVVTTVTAPVTGLLGGLGLGGGSGNGNSGNGNSGNSGNGNGNSGG